MTHFLLAATWLVLAWLATALAVLGLDLPFWESGGRWTSCVIPLFTLHVLAWAPPPRTLIGHGLMFSLNGALLVGILAGPFWPMVFWALPAVIGPVVIVLGVATHLMDNDQLPRWPPPPR